MEEENKMISVPYAAHEGMMVRMERTNHRLWILCIVLIIALIASNVAWVIYESQFEYYDESVITQEVTQNAEAEGDASVRFIGGDVNGESNTNSTDNEN